MTIQFPDIMVDLETTGTNPDRTAIIQIAACKFNHLTGEVDTNFFDQALFIPPWRSWDEDTRNWWMKQKPTILQGIFARMQPASQVMQNLGDWVGYEGPSVLWAKPLTFEFPFLSSYFKDFGVYNPFSFREAIDCRSYLTGLAYPSPHVDERELEFQGDKHNAIFDVLHQIRWVLHNQKLFGSPIVEVEVETMT